MRAPAFLQTNRCVQLARHSERAAAGKAHVRIRAVSADELPIHTFTQHRHASAFHKYIFQAAVTHCTRPCAFRSRVECTYVLCGGRVFSIASRAHYHHAHILAHTCVMRRGWRRRRNCRSHRAELRTEFSTRPGESPGRVRSY